MAFQNKAAFTASAVGQDTASFECHSPWAAATALKGRGRLQGSSQAGFRGAGVTSQKRPRREKQVLSD